MEKYLETATKGIFMNEKDFNHIKRLYSLLCLVINKFSTEEVVKSFFIPEALIQFLVNNCIKNDESLYKAKLAIDTLYNLKKHNDSIVEPMKTPLIGGE